MLRKLFDLKPLDRMDCDEIVVELLGGFGNQLFQLAYAVEISLKEDIPFRFVVQKGPWPFALEVLGLKNNASFKLINNNFVQVKIPGHTRKCKFDKYIHHGANFLPAQYNSRHISLNGYFQSEKYFSNVSEKLRKLLYSKLGSLNDSGFDFDYVAHVRLGDYVKKASISKVHGFLDEDYLSRALEHLSWDPSKKLCIITDDLESFEQLFPKHNKLASLVQSSNMYVDFASILHGPNKVISNSTFSWWAAWLGEGSVVAPKKWYADTNLLLTAKDDLFPLGWTLL
jgi:hypothetical protein